MKRSAPVCVGELRDLVTLKLKDTSADADGQLGPENSYTTVATVRARVREKGGREVTQGDRLHAPGMAEVVIRYRSDLEPPDGQKHTIEYRGRNFNIRHVKDWEQRKRWHILTIEEGVAQ